nr:zinc finger, CCHC-type, retrotransposon Gag domain protein [Tanacetum cinerariifolium]
MRQLPWTRRIGSLTWRRSLMSWVVRMHSRLDWRCISLRVMHLLGGKPLQFFPRAEQERLKREYHSIRQTNTETNTEFMQCFLRLAGFLGAAAGTEEEQAKNFQWGLRRQKSGDRHQPTTQQSSHRNHGHNNDRHGSGRRGIPVMGVTRETGVISPTDLPILVPSSPGVPLRATPIRFALRVDADTQESVVELPVLASSVVKLAICRRIARRTPLRVHLARL